MPRRGLPKDFQRWLDPIRVETRSDFLFREFRADDCLVQLTALLHAAYQDVKRRTGIAYSAAHQDIAATAEKIAKGETYLASILEEPIGTLTLYRPDEISGSPWYERSEVAAFGLFAVHPACQGLGVGRQLLTIAEQRARDWGLGELALDTADSPGNSVAMFERRQYRFIEYAQWPSDSFRSRIYSKTL